MLAFEKSEDDESVLTTWVFNQENVRKATAKMIIIDELPFKFVEGRGSGSGCKKPVLCLKYRLDGRLIETYLLFIMKTGIA